MDNAHQPKILSLAFSVAAAMATILSGAMTCAADDWLPQAVAARNAGKLDEAIRLATKAIEQNEKHTDAWIVRARLYSATKKFDPACTDYDRAIVLTDKTIARLFEERGSAHFCAGRFEKSVTDFDQEITIEPALERGHWKRGISYYYTGEFDKGRQQFEQYQTFDNNDVENAVWRFLCMARIKGVGFATARKELLKIKDDRRVPMKQVYDLFAGQAEPEDVLKAASAGRPTKRELNERLFYANLYLGLYHESAGDETLSRKHLAAAVEHPIEHYMWDVAKVHADVLEKKLRIKP